MMAGTLKATYDLGMLAVFLNHVSREDEAGDEDSRRDAGQDGIENVEVLAEENDNERRLT